MRGRLKFRYETFSPAFYWACTYALRSVLWLVGRWTVTGRDRIPAEGPLIVVSNHLSNADPPILGAGIARRRIRYMAKAELFSFPFGIVSRLYGAFPVRRFDADVAAILNAERLLKNGGVLGMFPEGTRSRTGYLGKPHPGTALLALRSGATVIPCAIAGTEHILNRPWTLLTKPRIAVHIGEPIAIGKVRRPTEEQVSELTDRIFIQIQSLLPAKYLASYTGNEGESAVSNGSDHPRK